MKTPRFSNPTRLAGLCGVIVALLHPAVLQAQGLPEDFGQAGAVFAGYEGTWAVTVKQPDSGEMVTRGSGTAAAKTRIGGRFLEIEATIEDGPVSQVLYVLGFDTRHRTYNIIAFDNTGTYFVTAAGDTTSRPPHIVMYGTDDDPAMREMGFDKAFAFVWHLGSLNHFSIQTRWIDTRTPAREEHLFMTLEFTREAKE